MLEGIKENITRLIALYEGERQRNGELAEQLARSEAQLGACRKRIEELTRQVDNLKLSGAFTGGSDNAEAKERLDKLIREIDKCIRLLEK